MRYHRASSTNWIIYRTGCGIAICCKVKEQWDVTLATRMKKCCKECVLLLEGRTSRASGELVGLGGAEWLGITGLSQTLE